MAQQSMPTATFQVDPDDAASVAADCFRAATQMRGGPVRDALLAMGRDYATRARGSAQTASFRLELEQASRAAPASWFTRLLEALIPAPPTRRVSAPVSAPATLRAAAPAIVRPARATRPAPVRPVPTQTARTRVRGSRLFRIHALTVPGA